MEIRDFAEKVLFGTTLEEKLDGPEWLTDNSPGPAIVAPSLPGRPAHLRFKSDRSASSEFPGIHRLDQEQERGRLLHFFANHELLATELMALVLLRFPDAPRAFRRGVLQTLKDEQTHTRLYIQRMRKCGIDFGELPVSGYFWRTISSMENPMDYVAGLSLTFEQANLDFCRQFSRGFSAVGDIETASLLDTIYRDEIGHVAYGLKWFRRWKNPNESDWEAFCRQLKFPLSPQRAKGVTLNVEGRRAAGLDPQFIAELNVYAQSKGRTPGVYVFNPFSEAYIAHGKAFTPVKQQRQLARDLANLPQFLCRQDDIVLVPKRPSVDFLGMIKEAGFALPEFVEIPENRIDSGSTLSQRSVGRLRPWAWGPDTVDLFKPIFGNVTGESRETSQRFNPQIARLYSKAWSAEFLRNVLSRGPKEEWLCTEQEVGMAVDSLESALAAIAAIRRRGHHKVVAKEALGLAGHNAIRLWEPDLLAPQLRWLEARMAYGRQLVIEPWLERERDFSVQLEMSERGLKICGFTGLINDRKGQFQGNTAAANHDRRIPADVVESFRDSTGMSHRLQEYYAEVLSLLEIELKPVDYLGPVSIDSFVFRAPDGRCRLKPIVEINPRYTMGRVTVELMKNVSPGSRGTLRLVNPAVLRESGCDSFVTYAHSLSQKFPLRFKGEPASKIVDGAVCLNDPAEAAVCLAVFQVEARF